MMCKRNIVFFQQQFVAFGQTLPAIPSIALLPCALSMRILSLPFLIPMLCHLAACIVISVAIGLPVAAAPNTEDGAPSCDCDADRTFVVSTRHLCTDVCRVCVNRVPFQIWQLDCRSSTRIDWNEYQTLLRPERPVVIYVHGNRMPADELVQRATKVRQYIRRRLHLSGVDWVYFSWPSERSGIGIRDVREKADRCDAEGLYLAKFLRPHVQASVPLAMIGYSFGARVVTGSLHALAGGCLGGRRLPEEGLTGANVRVALIAAAIESTWLAGNGYHGRATKNMDELMLLYNRRDAVLKRYWLIEKVRRETALGYSGPTHFAPRVDGTRLPVFSRDCSPSVRIRHAELDYYGTRCNAGGDMARLINGIRPAEL